MGLEGSERLPCIGQRREQNREGKRKEIAKDVLASTSDQALLSSGCWPAKSAPRRHIWACPSLRRSLLTQYAASQ